MELELADSTIKLLRLLANLCIEEGVGEKIAANSDIMEVRTYVPSLTSFIENASRILVISILCSFIFDCFSYHVMYHITLCQI